MADLVTHTRSMIPTPALQTSSDALPPLLSNSSDDDENDLAQAFVQASSSNRDNSQSPPPQSASRTNQPVQYSARRRHVIRRTYDSTDEEDYDGKDVVDTRKLREQMMGGRDAAETVVVTVEKPNHNSHLPSLAANIKRGLRGAFRPGKPSSSSRSLSTVSSENNAARVPPDASAVPDRTRTPSPPPQAPTPPSPDSGEEDTEGEEEQRMLSEEERGKLAIEQSRLERESRRLRRKPDRSKEDDCRLLDIASRLSKLSSTLAENVWRGGAGGGGGDGGGGGSLRTRAARTRCNGGMGKKTGTSSRNRLVFPPHQHYNNNCSTCSNGKGESGGKGRKPSSPSSSNCHNCTENISGAQATGLSSSKDNCVVSPVSDGNSPSSLFIGNESTSLRHHHHATTSSQHLRTPSGKRKKTWMALEAVKTLGRSVLSDGLGRRASTAGNHGGGAERRNDSNGVTGTAAGRTGGGGDGTGNVYEELGSRLTERGERLKQSSEASERMKRDAGDMAAAARSLRQRQQNKGFFG